MESLNLMLFFCLAAPLCVMLLVFRGRSRAVLGFMLTGIFMCLFAGEINGLILNTSGVSMRFLTVNITPIVEEFLKALPVVFIAFLARPKRQLLLEGSVAVGVGFATFENICMLMSAVSLSPELVLARGFGAGIMHSVSTLAVGCSMTFVSRSRKLSYSGTVAALSGAVIYHSIYNILVQSEHPLLGILLPMATCIPLFAVLRRKNQKESSPE